MVANAKGETLYIETGLTPDQWKGDRSNYGVRVALLNHITKIHMRVGSLVGFARFDKVTPDGTEIVLAVRVLATSSELSTEQRNSIRTMAKKRQTGRACH